jgi:hypothetical protein
VNIDEFATLLINSRIIGEHEVRKLVDAFREGCRVWGQEVSVVTFCDFLIETDRLTEWQCNKLRMGKWKGFYLDSYLLLGQVGKGPDFSSYAARDTRDGKLVCLVVTPTVYTNGRIEYCVEPYVDV